MLTATVSVHKATKTTSISHNNRALSPETLKDKYHDHIDPSRTQNNVTFVREDIHTAYEELFGEAVEQYNAKQKRSDRKIGDYYAKVRHDKTLEPQREFLIQVGNVNDFRTEDSVGQSTGLTASQVQANWSQAERTLTDYMTSFQQRNPQLHVYNAVMHNDEASPHLHINVIPVATGYQRGMSVRPSFNKALEAQGFARSAPDKHNRDQFTAWHQNEERALENALERQGASRVRGEEHVYLPPSVYKAKQQAAERRETVQQISRRPIRRSVSIDQPLPPEQPATSAALRAQNDEFRQQQQKDQKAIDYLQASVEVAQRKNKALAMQVKELQQLNDKLVGWLKETQEKALSVFARTHDWAVSAKQAMGALFRAPQAIDQPESLPHPTPASELIDLTSTKPEMTSSHPSEEKKPRITSQEGHKDTQEGFELHLGINTSRNSKTPQTASESLKQSPHPTDDRQKQQERLKQARLRARRQRREDRGLEL